MPGAGGARQDAGTVGTDSGARPDSGAAGAKPDSGGGGSAVVSNAPPCLNGKKDGTETGIDCGGTCPACPNYKINAPNKSNTIGSSCSGGPGYMCARSMVFSPELKQARWTTGGWPILRSSTERSDTTPTTAGSTTATPVASATSWYSNRPTTPRGFRSQADDRADVQHRSGRWQGLRRLHGGGRIRRQQRVHRRKPDVRQVPRSRRQLHRRRTSDSLWAVLGQQTCTRRRASPRCRAKTTSRRSAT